MTYKDPFGMICDFYGDRVARRSQVPLLNHIVEGRRIMEEREAPSVAIDAFTVHPMFQRDDDLRKTLARVRDIDPLVVALAMEYRAVANAGLREYWQATGLLPLSCLTEVNEMLIADKVQNRKDFEKHNAKHPEAEMLRGYFQAWMARLNIGEGEYQHLCEVAEGR